MYRWLGKGVFWGVLTTALVIVLQLALTLVLGRQSPELLGILNLIEIVIAGALAFFMLGGSVHFTNFLASRDERSGAAIAAFNTAIALAVAVAGVPMAKLFGVGASLGEMEPWLLAGVGVLALIIHHAAVATAARLDFLKSSFLEKGANLAVPVSLIALGYTIRLDASAVLITVASVYALVALWGIRSLGKPSATHLQDLRSYFDGNAWFLTATFVLIFAYERVDQVLVLHYFDLATLGIYYVCYKLSFSVRVLARIIVKAAYPIMAKLEHADSPENLQMSEVLLRANFAIAAVAATALSLGAPWILGLYGAQFVDYQRLLLIMSATLVFSVFNLVTGNIMNVKGRARSYFSIALATVTVQVVVLLATVVSLGVEAMAVSRLGAVLIGNVMSGLIVWRLGGLPRSSMRTGLFYGTYTVALFVATESLAAQLAATLLIPLLAVILVRDSSFIRKLWTASHA